MADENRTANNSIKLRKTTPEKRDALVNRMMDRFKPTDKKAAKSAFTDIVNQSENDKFRWRGYGMVPKGSLSGVNIGSKESAMGINTPLSMGNAVMIEDQGDDTKNGLLWAHEVGHDHGNQAQRPLKINSGFEKLYDTLDPENQRYIDYIRRENEMKSVYHEIDYLNNLMDGNYSGEPIKEQHEDIKVKMQLFSEGLQKAMGDDYNKTMVDKVVNWDRSGR